MKPRGPGALVLQGGLLLALAAFAGFLARNLFLNIARLNIHLGWGFLARPAGFEIAMHPIAYSAQSSYAAALAVGVLDTLFVAAASAIVATILGFALGLLHLSSNRLAAVAALAYVELVRNVPLLLQLFFWYFAVLGALPPPRQSLGFLGVAFLNRRGLYLATPAPGPGLALGAAALALGLAAWGWIGTRARRRRAATGAAARRRWLGPLAPIVLVCGAAWVAGAPVAVMAPALAGFDYAGGILIIPEFLALLLGLSIFGAAFIAELVRAGVLAVPSGQSEAARALGLASWPIYRRIVLPQAMRTILPPLVTQYILILKNSSLGAAIAYPELMLVSGTVLNQTGQPIEVMAITMATYLALCLGIAAAGNALNRRLRLAAA